MLGGRRGDLRGILNGIDFDEWNPATDPALAERFDIGPLAGKARCKAALQREVGLPERPDLPLFGVHRSTDPQKGFDVLAHALDRLLAWELQVVLLGSGDHGCRAVLRAHAYQRGDKFRAYIGFDEGLAHRIEAGCDFFLMPSRFEPCGLNQMYSLRYGTLPVVRATGGLVDTVQNYDERTVRGTGFMFGDLTVDGLGNTIGWALSTYFDRPEHIEPCGGRRWRRTSRGSGRRRIRTAVPGRLRPPPRARLRAVAAPSLMANGHHADCSARPLKVRVTTGVMFTIRRG